MTRPARRVPSPAPSCHCTVWSVIWPRWSRTGFVACSCASRTFRWIWFDPAIDDSELVPLDDAEWESDLAAWFAQCEVSRAAAARHELDDTGIRRGEPCSLRWIYVHMIEEYARHNGHADLLRELVDGAVGW